MEQSGHWSHLGLGTSAWYYNEDTKWKADVLRTILSRRCLIVALPKALLTFLFLMKSLAFLAHTLPLSACGSLFSPVSFVVGTENSTPSQNAPKLEAPSEGLWSKLTLSCTSWGVGSREGTSCVQGQGPSFNIVIPGHLPLHTQSHIYIHGAPANLKYRQTHTKMESQTLSSNFQDPQVPSSPMLGPVMRGLWGVGGKALLSVKPWRWPSWGNRIMSFIVAGPMASLTN